MTSSAITRASVTRTDIFGFIFLPHRTLGRRDVEHIVIWMTVEGLLLAFLVKRMANKADGTGESEQAVEAAQLQVIHHLFRGVAADIRELRKMKIWTGVSKHSWALTKVEALGKMR